MSAEISLDTLDTSGRDRRHIALWLLVCCALIFAMVVLGGVTRLTRSGLSMVEWDPIMGVVPPLNQAQWEETFEKYKRFPEYQKINRHMGLAEFKRIFWFEYSHRLLGRIIGLAFLLPFLYFLLRRKFTTALVPKLIAMFVLGGLQGLLGWYMVKSGLVDKPHVSPYRLTAHLAAAVAIYAYIFWVALDLLKGARPAVTGAVTALRKYAWGVTALIGLMILSGGLVAGNKAGFAFNTFPKMHGRWVPEGLLAMEPWWINAFENIATVQFNHRLLALVLVAAIVGFWIYARRQSLERPLGRGIHLLLLMLAVQVALGISTLVYVVPIPLAAAHQAGALALLTIALYVNHRLRVSH